MRLVYTAPAAAPGYVTPYYPPPPSGKVSPANNVIGAELFSLSQYSAPIATISQNEIFILDGAGKVMIEVVSKIANDNTLKTQLKALGMTDTVNNGPHTFVITGFIPISNLVELNSNARIQYVRPLYPAISNAGQVTTQGDTTMRSNNVRTRFGVDGSGVKIGVISDSYNSKGVAQNDVDEGDLPGIKSSGQLSENPEPVQVLADLPQRGNDEGRAMLQIVHDVAPKSKLAFRTGFLTAGDFAKGIQDLASPTLPGGRCDVIVDDITYITEPFLRDGVVAQAVDQVAAQGVTYFSSAGNFGSKSYEAVFSGVTNTSLIPTGQIHKFGSSTGDIYQTVNLKPGSYTIVLQWNDEFHSLGSTNGVQTDMDLYLVGATGFTLFGFNRSNLFGDPFEVCPFTVSEETNAKLMVVRASGTANVRFKFIIFRGEATMQDFQTGTSSIVGHPNAEGAIAVGAMLYANIPSITPVWPGVASFSSKGGTRITQNNITLPPRNKPELVGPNGVNTTVNLGSATFNDGDPYPNFFGTSAAAPHVAAVGALLIQGRKKFNLQPTVTPAEIKQQLISSAGKFSYLPGNFSFEGGFGYAQADSAMVQIANARPIISSLETVVPGAQNGTQPFEVKIKGRYITGNTQIYFSGSPVATTVSADKTEVTATIPAITNGQDPALQLYNPPKSPSQIDGGLSEALHFFSSIIDITVRAQNKSRKYGQSNPVFTAEVLYNGVPVTNPDTLAKLKLNGNNLSFTTIATSASSAGLYGLFPVRTTPLANNDPLLTNYGFTFVSGTLSVGKMPLKITPNNKTVTYGEDIGPFSYTYELDPSSQTSATLVDEAKALHTKYLANNGLIVLNGSNQNSAVSLSDLANMSTMASFQSVRNARKFVLENGQVKPLVNDIDPSLIGSQRFFVDVSIASLQNYKLDSARSPLVQPGSIPNARGFLNIKALMNGNARASLPNGQLQAMVNGQLLAMVNGQSMPIVNGQLMAMVNGQLQAMVNGQLLAIVNGQLMALVNGQLEIVQGLTLVNGQLQALVNGQLQALVNGQLKAMVNGIITNISTTDINLVNGQLQVMVNGQLQALVNGQLQALVNGQLQALVNGAGVAVSSVRQLANGQLQALVNGTYIPIANGQLQALVNGQLLAMVNGQLMAVVNGQVSFVVFLNGQLQALVNGQLQALVNGQLQAMVNGQLQVVNSYSITNGQLQALVNGQTWVYANGQLLALVNGQLQALVNNFDVSGTSNNAKTLVIVDGDDITLQSGDIGAMFAVNMITGLDAGIQTLIPGAFVNENFEVTYGFGLVEISKALITAKPNDTTRVYGEANPAFTMSYSGLKYDDGASDITTPPGATTTASANTSAGTYPIIIAGGSTTNYSFTSYLPGTLTITKKALIVTADNKSKLAGSENPPLTITYNGLVGDDTKDSVCVPYVIPPSPKVIEQLYRTSTYTDIKLNNGPNFINATPGQVITLTGHRNTVYNNPSNYCPGCITQLYIGMMNATGSGNVFTNCYDVSLGNLTAPGNAQAAGLSIQFPAPTVPGVYYITQVSSWEFKCYDRGSGNPGNDPNNAIAVVVVNVSNESITAGTAANAASPAGSYPIILQGCDTYSPNYAVTLQNGTLSVTNINAGTGMTPRVTMGSVVKEVSLADKLYPNPALLRVRLELAKDVRRTGDIQVYDMVGKLFKLPVQRINEKIYDIDVSALSPGVYFIKAKSSGALKTFRFVKL
ncbi:MAG: MBG domain-containing protein [Chitinophagaceae bacterium]